MASEPAWLSLSTVESFVPIARKRGVSEVARSARGFVAAYRRAGGKPGSLPEAWRRKRNNFVKRHMAQVRANKEQLIKNGKPSRRLLALIMWAYSPVRVKAPRENPYVGDPQPDLFGGESQRHIPLEEATEEQIARGRLTAPERARFTEHDAPKVLSDRAEKAFEKADRRLAALAKLYVQDEIESYTGEHGYNAEHLLDYLSSDLEHNVSDTDLLAVAAEHIDDELETDDDAINSAILEILRDPDNWDFSCKETNGYGGGEPLTIIEDEVRGSLPENKDDEFYKLLDRAVKVREDWGLSFEDACKQVRRLLESSQAGDMYIDVKDTLKDYRDDDREWMRSTEYVLPAKIKAELTLNADKFNAALAEVFKGEKRPTNDTTAATVVYRFANGWYVDDLSPKRLVFEGKIMRHCVGRPGMGYGARISSGAIKIYSLRKDGKPSVTMEVRLDNRGRPVSVEQAKAFSNNLPGFVDKSCAVLSKPDLVLMCAEFIREYLGLDPEKCTDLAPGLRAIQRAENQPRTNPDYYAREIVLDDDIRRLALKAVAKPFGPV